MPGRLVRAPSFLHELNAITNIQNGYREPFTLGTDSISKLHPIFMARLAMRQYAGLVYIT